MPQYFTQSAIPQVHLSARIFASIPPQGSWEVEQVIKEFIDESESFIESYFEKGETIKDRVLDFDQVLEDLT